MKPEDLQLLVTREMPYGKYKACSPKRVLHTRNTEIDPDRNDEKNIIFSTSSKV